MEVYDAKHFQILRFEQLHNIYKILLKTSTAQIKHTTTSIYAHLSIKGTKVIFIVASSLEYINQWC